MTIGQPSAHREKSAALNTSALVGLAALWPVATLVASGDLGAGPAAGLVHRADLAWQASASGSGEHRVLLDVTVRGRRGRRVRHRRAMEFENRVSAARRAAFLAAGAFVWGGGLRLRLTAEAGGAASEGEWDPRPLDRVWPEGEGRERAMGDGNGRAARAPERVESSAAQPFRVHRSFVTRPRV